MAERLYDTLFDNDEIVYDDGTLGGWWDVLGQSASTATGVGLSYLLGGGQGGQQGGCHAPAGCFQCTMTGQGDIAGCLDNLLVGPQGLYTLLVNGQIPNNQVLQLFQQAQAAVGNAQFFRQTDAYVQQVKTVLQGYIDRYQGTSTQGVPTTTNPATGQPAATQTATGGIDNTTLILLGGGLLLLMFLKN